MFFDKQLHNPRRQSHSEWVIPKGKLAAAPVLPRITLHRSLFPVTSGLGRAMQYGRLLPTAGVIAVK
jgi:hypothetical protein